MKDKCIWQIYLIVEYNTRKMWKFSKTLTLNSAETIPYIYVFDMYSNFFDMVWKVQSMLKINYSLKLVHCGGWIDANVQCTDVWLVRWCATCTLVHDLYAGMRLVH